MGRRWLPMADKGPDEHRPSHLHGDLGRGLAAGISNTAGCHPGGAMDILPLPAEALVGSEPLSVEAIAAYVVAAVWAPSVHNTQPWWFSVAGQEISLYADFGRQLMVADPRGREMMISCGAALFTARLAPRSLGYIPETSVLPDPVRPLLVARVSWQRVPRLGPAIQTAVSVRRPPASVLFASGGEHLGISHE